MVKKLVPSFAYILLMVIAVSSALAYDFLGVSAFWSLGWLILTLIALLVLIEIVYNAIPRDRKTTGYVQEENYECLLDEINRRISKGENISSNDVEKRIFYFTDNAP